MANFNATENLDLGLLEVKVLLRYAAKNRKSLEKYGLFNKSAIILLSTKFECFIEDILAEYVYEYCSKCGKDSIDAAILTGLSDRILDDVFTIHNNVEKREKKLILLQQLARLYLDDGCNFSDYVMTIKFALGKHGEQQIKKLFLRCGLDDFHTHAEASGFYENLNSLISIRNNIIHEDATPSLTEEDVKKHIDEIENFSLALDSECFSRIPV